MAYEPTLVQVQPVHGGPGVALRFPTLHTGAAGLNVWRTAGGRRYPVRSGVRAAVSGAAGFFDPEPPFGVTATYFAEALDADGDSLGFTGTADIRIDSDMSWIHNPLNPAGGIPVRVAARTGETIAGQNQVNVYYPIGRAAGIAVTGQRLGIPNVPLVVWTDSPDDAAALDAMFGQPTGDLTLPPFLCVRLASRFTIPLPRPLFLAVPSPTRTPVNAVAGGTRLGWDISGAEVSPPTPALATTLLSRADLDTYYATRQTRDTAYASRLEMDTDYTLAGYAGVPAADPVPPATP